MEDTVDDISITINYSCAELLLTNSAVFATGVGSGIKLESAALTVSISLARSMESCVCVAGEQVDSVPVVLLFSHAWSGISLPWLVDTAPLGRGKAMSSDSVLLSSLCKGLA